MLRKNKSERLVVYLLIFFTVSMSVTTFLATYFINQYTSMLEENIRHRLMLTAKEASKLLTDEDLEQFTVPEDMKKYEYLEICKSLHDFSRENSLEYTYFMRKQGDEIVYIFDSDIDPNTWEELGNVVEQEEAMFSAFRGTAACNELGQYVEEWEGIISAYAPVYDKRGNVIAIAGIDFSDKEMLSIKSNTHSITYIIFFEVMAFIIVSTVGIISYSRKAKAYQEASMAKSQFLARMSHEIRTPMNAIIGFCRMAKASDDMNKVKSHLTNISNSSEFLLELINGILDLSKIEAGKLALVPVKTSPNAFIENIESMMTSQMQSKNLNFKMEIGGNIPKHINCDDTKLMQIIINLLSNAVKFTPESGEITLSMVLMETKGEQCRLQFAVSDTGIGIEQKYIESLFDAFEQGDGSITRKYGGTGLGLAISKLLVEKMGGKMMVSSVIGEGSQFVFDGWFEIIHEGNEGEFEGLEETPVEHKDCTGKRFLVVEDNEINRIVAQNAFEEELGAITDFAENGEIGVQKFLEAHDTYDIIFMDIQMPVMDGFEATRRIRASGVNNAGTIPIIAMSANVFQEDVDTAIESGMNAHIGKPFEIERIQEVINSVL